MKSWIAAYGTPLALFGACALLAGCNSGDAASDPVPDAHVAGGKSGSFRALTYNVGGLPTAVPGSNPEKSMANARSISPLLNGYDLVLMQEDWGDPVVQMREQGLPPVDTSLPPLFGYHHLIVAEAKHPFRSEPARHPFGTDLRRGLDGALGPLLLADGLNRLSQFPFGPIQRVMWRSCNGSILVTPLKVLIETLGLSALFESLNLAGDSGLIDDGAGDCGAQKGFSVATHTLAPGVEIDVYNLHADASGHDRDLDARADNFRQLTEFILAHSTGRAVIVGGDTNLRFDPSRSERQRENDGGAWHDFLTKTGLTEVCALVACSDLDMLRAEGSRNVKIHDRFAFRGGGIELVPVSHRFEHQLFARGDGEPLSDHDPAAVIFEWRLIP